MSRFIPYQLFNSGTPSLSFGNIYPPLSDDQKLAVYREVRQNLLDKYSKLCVMSSEDTYHENQSECQKLWDLLYFDANHN